MPSVARDSARVHQLLEQIILEFSTLCDLSPLLHVVVAVRIQYALPDYDYTNTATSVLCGVNCQRPEHLCAYAEPFPGAAVASDS